MDDEQQSGKRTELKKQTNKQIAEATFQKQYNFCFQKSLWKNQMSKELIFFFYFLKNVPKALIPCRA